MDRRVVVGLIGMLFLSIMGAGMASADDRVLICHIAQENPNSVRTMAVVKSEVDAHLAHGDSLGRCPRDPAAAARETPPPLP